MYKKIRRPLGIVLMIFGLAALFGGVGLQEQLQVGVLVPLGGLLAAIVGLLIALPNPDK